MRDKKTAPGSQKTPKSLPVLVEVAHKYYIGKRQGQALAAEYRVSQATISSWLREAEDRNLIRYDIDPSFLPSGKQDLQASKELEDYAGLTECWVYGVDDADLKLPSLASGQPSIASEVTAKNKNFALLESVTSTVAEHIVRMIKPGAVVGTAGGRAVNRLCRHLDRWSNGSVNNTHVTSLTGRIWNKQHTITGDPTFDRPLEGDDNALELSMRLAHGMGSSLIQFGLRLYCDDPSKRDALIRSNCPVLKELVDGERPEKDLTLALLGVGSFEDHRLQKYSEGLGVEAAELLLGKAAADYLSKADDIVRDYGLKAQGDVANRLFSAFPFPDDKILKGQKKFLEGMKSLAEELENLNNLAIAPEFFQLRRAHRSVLVATGKSKWEVVWTIALVGYLFPGRGLVTSLVTDSGTAKKLNAAFKALKDNPAMESFYKEAFESTNMFDFKDIKIKKAPRQEPSQPARV